MIHTEVSTTIRAPQPTVVATYRDYRNWPRLFPRTIKGVHLLCEETNKTVLLIEHTEGRVINMLTYVSSEEIQLQEFKRRYDAQFVNRFAALPDGTRFTLAADITLKGVYQLFTPFLLRYIRWQMEKFVLNPVKSYAEDSRNTLLSTPFDH
jgi:hypothetical protein